jgi:hypothetical protein
MSVKKLCSGEFNDVIVVDHDVGFRHSRTACRTKSKEDLNGWCMDWCRRARSGRHQAEALNDILHP